MYSIAEKAKADYRRIAESKAAANTECTHDPTYTPAAETKATLCPRRCPWAGPWVKNHPQGTVIVTPSKNSPPYRAVRCS
jgi:hypothetical protein